MLRNDPGEKFLFAPLQSAESKEFLLHLDRDLHIMDSILFYDKGKLFERSTAVLRIAFRMNKLYPLLSLFLIVPRFIRDSVYNLIGKYRYRWFGKRESCMIPEPKITRRFIFMDSLP